VHRVGRVARAGRSGMAYSFVAPDEVAIVVVVVVVVVVVGLLLAVVTVV
jgi:hypothetical protein